MNKNEFEQFVLDSGKDILRFCRMTTRDDESGNDLYQDTMLKLLEKQSKLDSMQNVRSYALSISILLWRNKKKKYSARKRILPISSLEEYVEDHEWFEPEDNHKTPEQHVLEQSEVEEVQALVAKLPEKYRIPIYLSYSADMKLDEIAECLHIPISTVKTRIRKAKILLKEQLEAIGYDR
ncbi:MAG: RNA polymerase sigma factor [Roseburia sp.]